jgi:hypothetical protein
MDKPEIVVASHDIAIDIPRPGHGVELYKPSAEALSKLPRLCGEYSDLSRKDIRLDDIRTISDEHCSAGNPSSNGYGLTNMGAPFNPPTLNVRHL